MPNRARDTGNRRHARAKMNTEAATPTLRNHTPVRDGRSSAICECCGKTSRPTQTDRQGEPSLFHLARGWSMAPYPPDCIHADGSIGSTYTCPACNRRLRAGEFLRTRDGHQVRHLSEL